MTKPDFELHATDIVGYTYNADEYCEHCTAVLFEREDDEAPSIFQGAEAILDYEALRRGIDRHDEATFDSGEFPKVIFASQGESDDERCGSCHDPLVSS